MSMARVIAFYLPQFYPIPENDEWWGPGFTEWTNVAKAKPLFKGHYQPRIPRDLGFYDLRVPEVREKQAQLAREAGIEGFCYWHYWFEGKRLLERPINEVLSSGKPDFPFCFCWANHSWKAKTWTDGVKDKMLLEQKYGGVEDYASHFYSLLPAFRDHRYLKSSNGNLIFGIFDFDYFDDFETFKNTWNKLSSENGLPKFEFFALVQGKSRMMNVKEGLYDRLVYDALSDTFKSYSLYSIRRIVNSIRVRLGFPIKLASYNDYVRTAVSRFKELSNVTPCIVPMFDHSPRSTALGVILHKNNPKLWGKLCGEVKEIVESNSNIDDMVFIKAWNEWGEGNYMEPDLRFGKKYIEESGKAFKKAKE